MCLKWNIQDLWGSLSSLALALKDEESGERQSLPKLEEPQDSPLALPGGDLVARLDHCILSLDHSELQGQNVV